jgi:hypothetical protein
LPVTSIGGVVLWISVNMIEFEIGLFLLVMGIKIFLSRYFVTLRVIATEPIALGTQQLGSVYFIGS